MQELPILRNSAGQVIRILGVPDGEPPRLSVIQNGSVVKSKPIKPKWEYMPKDFQDTMPTQPAHLDEQRHFHLPEYELRWTKRLLFVSIVIAVAAVLLAIVA